MLVVWVTDVKPDDCDDDNIFHTNKITSINFVLDFLNHIYMYPITV